MNENKKMKWVEYKKNIKNQNTLTNYKFSTKCQHLICYHVKLQEFRGWNLPFELHVMISAVFQLPAHPYPNS